MKRSMEIVEAWDELGLDLLDLGVISERMESLGQRYGKGSDNLDLFWVAFAEIGSRISQLYFDLSQNRRILSDFYNEGILPAYAQKEESALECVAVSA